MGASHITTIEVAAPRTASAAFLRTPGDAQSISIFSRRYELLCLAIPLLFLALVAFEVFFFTLLTGEFSQQRLTQFVTSVIFLNTIHVYFTYACLIRVPEFQLWIDRDTGGRPWRFWVEISIVGVATLAALLIAGNYFDASSILWVLASMCILIIPIHHVIKQNYGLSMIYTAKARLEGGLDDGQLRALKKNASRERLGFRVFMVFYFASLVLTGYRWVFRLEDVHFATANNGLYAITAATLLFLFVNCLNCPGASHSNKFVFLIRLILYPLMPFSRFADAGLRAAHGTEYLCVTASILRNSSATYSRRREVFHLIVLLSAIGFVLIVCSYDELVVFVLGQETGLIAGAIRALGLLGLTLTFMHYYIDRRLFRFSNELNREVIVPLLMR